MVRRRCTRRTKVMARKPKFSDPLLPDRARTGDDLLTRIDELTESLDAEATHGWRPLLVACGREIGHLRAELLGIARRIERQEQQRKS